MQLAITYIRVQQDFNHPLQCIMLSSLFFVFYYLVLNKTKAKTTVFPNRIEENMCEFTLCYKHPTTNKKGCLYLHAASKFEFQPGNNDDTTPIPTVRAVIIGGSGHFGTCIESIPYLYNKSFMFVFFLACEIESVCVFCAIEILCSPGRVVSSN